MGTNIGSKFTSLLTKTPKLAISWRRKFLQPKVVKNIVYRMASQVECTGRQIHIPTPIGSIAGLEWGPPEGIRVLALHGWQDNSMSFQPLIPYLPPNLRVIAIDFPGHGLSPHLGLGAHYTHFGLLNNVFQITKSLKWDKFNIIGHSLGAMIGIQFAAFYPQRLERLVTLDTLYPSVQATNAVKMDSLTSIMKIHTEMEIREAAPPLEITWDDAFKVFSKDRKTSEENIRLLMTRGLKPSTNEGKYIVRRDHRIRHLNVPKLEFTDAESVMTMLENYQGVWLAVMARGDEVSPKRLEREKQMKERYKAMKLFRVERLPGTHFLHMNDPSTVGKIICEIFKEAPSKL